MTRLDRRVLFTSGAAAALLAATGVSLTGAPRSGGHLRLAVPRDGTSLHAVARGAVFDTLTEIAPNGALQGELATGWHSASDARIWRFDLRGDARFHDGAPLAVSDVAASVLARDPSGIVAIEQTGQLQVQVELRASDPHLPFRLADPAFGVAPADQIDAPFADWIGTGRFRVQAARPDRSFRAVRVDGHYKQGRAGWTDSVEVVVIPDPAVRAEALRDGFVDVAVLPHSAGLLGRGDFLFHPSAQDMAIAARRGVGMPRVIGNRAPLDDGRIAERWWLV